MSSAGAYRVTRIEQPRSERLAYHDDLFPTGISYDSRFATAHNTSVHTLPSGGEQRTARWSRPRIVFDVKLRNLSRESMLDLAAFHRAREGRVHSFPVLDWTDYSTNPSAEPSQSSFDALDATSSDELIGTGDGSNTDFQLVKNYTSGSTTKSRLIEKPIVDSVFVQSNAVELVEGVGFTVDYSTGIVTLASAPSNGHLVRAGCKFYVPSRFEQDELALDISSYQSGSVPALSAIEVLPGESIDDEWHFGGASTQSWAGTLALSPSMGAMIRLNPTAAATLKLPSFSNYKRGVGHATLQNISAYDVDIDYQGATLATLAAGDRCSIALGFNSAGTASEWIVLQ